MESPCKGADDGPIGFAAQLTITKRTGSNTNPALTLGTIDKLNP